ncbi:MAG: SUMF1/EgtB/PvdO family nonheme iron enzyme, partial [Myxococcales bacterium]|nr:SUMF1/EgtB/PvdO family nonheme iron enzyme [Myxococcales bacterium]
EEPEPVEPVEPVEPKEQPLVAPDGTRVEPCGAAPPGMACVPGGPFIRGDDDGPENARPKATIWLQSFYMDINEVTFAEYKACEKAKRCPRAGPQYLDFSRPEQPINGISWFDADAYCKAQGKRLPSESQWEKAARGPDGELYPWGDDPPSCELAIIKTPELGRGCGLKKAGEKPDTGRVWPVGSRPAFRYGLHDMAGNSYEWVADWYTRSYEQCGDACAGFDPKGPCAGEGESCPGYRHKVVRGGSWYWDASRNLGYHRRAHVPNNNPFHHFGFRCAATLEDAKALASAPAPASE